MTSLAYSGWIRYYYKISDMRKTTYGLAICTVNVQKIHKVSYSYATDGPPLAPDLTVTTDKRETLVAYW